MTDRQHHLLTQEHLRLTLSQIYVESGTSLCICPPRTRKKYGLAISENRTKQTFVKRAVVYVMISEIGILKSFSSLSLQKHKSMSLPLINLSKLFLTLYMFSAL